MRPLLFGVWYGLLLVFSLWLMVHTFSYDQERHTMRIAVKVWSDFGSHIPLIRSFSQGNNWPPEYPLFPREPIRYHFLFYFLVGILEKTGVRLDWALNIPSALGFFLLLLMIFKLSYHLFSNYWVSFLSILFFLFNGSLSFLRFFKNHAVSEIFTNQDFPSFAPWGPGEISAFWNLNIYTNQRHLGLAFGLGLGLIYLFLKLEKKSFKKQLPWLIPASLILGVYPYLHQPTLLMLAVFMLAYFLVFPRLRLFLFMAGLTSSILVLPQIMRLTTNVTQFAWHPGYLIHNQLTITHFLSYWWQNLGLHSILIPVGYFLTPKSVKKAMLPIFIIFIMANLFKFSVEVAAGHKFFNFVLILGNMISAYLLIKLLSFIRIRLLAYLLICLLVAFLTSSGIIDFFPVVNDRYLEIADVGRNKVATWIASNTPPSAVFLNSSFLYHPASLAGRKIFFGWPYFPWSAGYDSFKRMDEMKILYSSKNTVVLCQKLNKYNISYVTYQTGETYPEIPFTNEDVYRTSANLVYEDETAFLRIYDVRRICSQ